MSVDISALGELQPVEPLDLENYADNREPSPLPPAGVYTFQAPEKFTLTRSQAGAMLAKFDTKIVGSASEGYTLRFNSVSGKVFKRGQKNASQLGDYLRACGLRGQYTDEAAQAEALDQTSNKTFQAECDWKVWIKETKTEIVGMEKFPSDGNGGHEPYFYSGEKDENGNPKRYRANLTIVRYIPAVE